MQHAPEIEDEAVIAIGQGRDAREQRNGHVALLEWTAPNGIDVPE